jgi:aminoglycoside phosphotransferase (APT) family kinase protein
MANIGLELLAEGRTAEVFAWEDGAVVKLFRSWVPPRQAEVEAKLARAVSDSGLPVPWVGEIVDVDGRMGLVYERVDGSSLLDRLKKRPWTLSYTAKLLASLHARMHAVRDVPGVPRQREELKWKIEASGRLSPRLRSLALDRLGRLPDSDVLCHGDFHPGNILMTQSGPVLIDWIDATCGHPYADVARTLIIARFGVPRGGSVSQRVLRASARGLSTIYEREYGRLCGTTHADVVPWLPVVAAARIQEDVDEVAELAAFVEQSFCGVRP